MKKIISVFLLLSIVVAGFSQNEKYESIAYIDQPTAGVLRLHATGYGKNAKACMEDAQKKAFRVILFKGISGSPVSTPLIPGDIAGMNMDGKTASFFEEATYKTFVPRITQYSALKKTKLGKQVVVDMDVDYHALRSYFEQLGIIRKFGL